MKIKGGLSRVCGCYCVTNRSSRHVCRFDPEITVHRPMLPLHAVIVIAWFIKTIFYCCFSGIQAKKYGI